MIMDGKGKLFGKVSIVDVLIVVIILAAVGGIGYKLTKSKLQTPFTQSDNIQIKFYSEEVPDFVLNAINKGDLAKDFERNVEFGHVTDVKADKSVSWTENDKGENIAAPKAGYSSAIVTIEGKGIFRDSKNYAGVTFGGSDFFVGRTITLLAGHSTFQCRIYDIKKKG